MERLLYSLSYQNHMEKKSQVWERISQKEGDLSNRKNRRWNGRFGIKSSVPFWYFLFSLKTIVPGLNLGEGFFTPSVTRAKEIDQSQKMSCRSLVVAGSQVDELMN
ncbi:hypothetical protein NE237_003401 [Protea cynaroides]|uniref:Uncharacterized protein n=1 Tax=Protea cynaroides TaxID=273540 RepID=A0A9Q0QSK4_9MAGN|nr:hypothetical protein NE237_003401 [Protea cynaroides]